MADYRIYSNTMHYDNHEIAHMTPVVFKYE